MKILVTGGAGFIGSHVAEKYAREGHEVVVFDNLSRATLLSRGDINQLQTWHELAAYRNIQLVRGDVRERDSLTQVMNDVEVIVHAAAQTAVTTSIRKPYEDFSSNVVGALNVLEAARLAASPPAIIFCSTNKVYGNNVNGVAIEEGPLHYRFADSAFRQGIPETFSIDRCEHTPYGCSKLAGDLYMQDYAHLYGLKIGVFRMSCIYGTRQMGAEDQGWVAWFAIAAHQDKTITIYGDGKQVRDVLYVDDLIDAYDAFLRSERQHEVYNIGGGPQNTLSLLELITLLERHFGKKCQIQFSEWRPSDQKVYISNIENVKKDLHWTPTIDPEEGVTRLVEWVRTKS